MTRKPHQPDVAWFDASFSPVVFVSFLAAQQDAHKDSKLMMMMMILHMFLKSGLITKNPMGAGVCWILAVKSSIQTAAVDWTRVCFWRIIVLSHQLKGEEQARSYFQVALAPSRTVHFGMSGTDLSMFVIGKKSKWSDFTVAYFATFPLEHRKSGKIRLKRWL